MTQRFLDALNTWDPVLIEAVLGDAFVFEDVSGPGERSRRAFLDVLHMMRSAFPDLTFRATRHALSEEGRTVIEFKAMGTHQGEFLGVAPTGAFTIISGAFNLAHSDGRVTRLRQTIDFAGLRRQLLMAAGRSGLS